MLDPVVARTPLQGAVQLDRLHATFLRMNGSGVIFVAARSVEGAQDLMLDYLATTDATGALPLYNRDTYARALESGRVPRRRATDGA